jgi:hypothetical protein
MSQYESTLYKHLPADEGWKLLTSAVIHNVRTFKPIGPRNVYVRRYKGNQQHKAYLYGRFRRVGLLSDGKWYQY